ncbi:MAG: hypothetical protein IT441_09540 [Phycisphaeraceae bacterium]|nr:hypothetical protein [Phycisphaeraceae bacterium]
MSTSSIPHSYEAPLPPGTDPMICNPVSSIETRWICNQPGFYRAPWTGAVIAWPRWAAYECNARSKDQSRTVHALADGRMLYPYMGPWANGGQITVVSGDVLIIEWNRGSETWREKRLKPGDTYTIALQSHEDNAMIESPDGVEPKFTVSLANFKPQCIR